MIGKFSRIFTFISIVFCVFQSQTSDNSNQFETIGSGKKSSKPIDLFSDQNENGDFADFNPRAEESGGEKGDYVVLFFINFCFFITLSFLILYCSFIIII